MRLATRQFHNHSHVILQTQGVFFSGKAPAEAVCESPALVGIMTQKGSTSGEGN